MPRPTGPPGDISGRLCSMASQYSPSISSSSALAGATSCGRVPAVNAHELSAWVIPALEAEGPQVPRLIALVEPSARPRWSVARRPKYGSPVDTLMTVSKPFRGANPTDFSSPGAGPASTSQVATSVAPFQLA